MADQILTAVTADGSISLIAGITTELVRETQRRHELAPTTSAAVGRLITGTALLGTALKGRERLSLQVAGNGPLHTLTADVEIVGPQQLGVRAYTSTPGVELPLNENGKFDVGGAIGSGWLQATRSLEVGQPYVGIVPLISGEISEDIAAYLMQSEQIPSVVAIGVLASPDGIRAAGGVIAQLTPSADEKTIEMLEQRARELLPITTQISAGADAHALLHALVGSMEPRLHNAYTVRFTCRCKRERVELALMSLGRDELIKLAREQEETEALCEFCKKRYVLTRHEVGTLITRLEDAEKSG